MPSRFLVITEKPSSARKIAYALDDSGSPRSAKYGKVSYYIVNHDRDELVIVSAVGHLYSIDQIGGGWKYPVFDIKWTPAYTQNKRSSYTTQYLDAIIGLAQNMDGYVSACDYDQEGSLIAYNIIKHGIGDKALAKSRRMLYNTLTTKELVTSWRNLSNTLDFPVIAAGKARHEADWLIGINLSRAITIASRRSLDKKKVLSIGRVQGPTLKFVYDLEQSIQSFIPIPFWKVLAETEIDGVTYPLEYERPRLEREVQANEVAAACRGKTGKAIEIKTEKSRTPPPPPFNLSDLQREAYKHFKMSPSATLAVAEKLYLGAYTSYPRTESNKIHPSVDVKDILENLSKNPLYEIETKELISQKRFRSITGKGDDPAHPAIHPTSQQSRRLKSDEQRIYDLVVRRFLASLSKPLNQLKTEVTVNVNGHLFNMRGVMTQKTGWTQFYEPYYRSKDKNLPVIKHEQDIHITNLSTQRQYTKPPTRYNASLLMHKMKQEKIGTKATRSNIIDTLYNRDYICGESISISGLGERVIETLERYCPEIIQVKLTRDLEEELENVAVGKKTAEAVLSKVIAELKQILLKFKDNEAQIGQSISDFKRNNPEDYSTSCKICDREKAESSVFCPRHQAVYENIESGFQQWRYALGYQWREYLEKIIKIIGTGNYAKEIINNILS